MKYTPLDNVMTVDKRHDSGDDTQTRLDLLLTKEPDRVLCEVTYGCPMEKNDHVMIEFRVQEEKIVYQKMNCTGEGMEFWKPREVL